MSLAAAGGGSTIAVREGTSIHGGSTMAVQTQSANLFELSCGDTQVTYSTSSFAGPPQLSYTDSGGSQSFSGADIETRDSALGSEVTVTLEEVEDLHLLTLTLVVPDTRLDRGGEEQFDTIAIRTTNATTIAGPPPVAQSYDVVALHGVAKLVDF
jgi:hypothetical protein